jgi:ribonuclease P protein component
MRKFPSLKSGSDFKRVYDNGISYGNKFLVMYILKNTYSENRLGISISKKVGNSVIRHKITRQLREIFKLDISRYKKYIENEYKNNQLNMYYDIVIIVRKDAAVLEYNKLRDSFMHLYSRFRLRNK